MPNEPGVRNVPWQTYQTTMAAIEALSGYDLLALLPDKTEDIVQRGIQPPIAAVDGPTAAPGATAVAMSAASSVAPDGPLINYAWSFADRTTDSCPPVTPTFAR